MNDEVSPTVAMMKKSATKTKPAEDKAATGGKVEKATKVKAGAVELDVISDTAFEIENLTKEKALSLLETLVEDIELNSFKLGGIFSVVQTNEWFDGYPTLKEFVENKYGMAYRKAMYLIQIYNTLVTHQIPWSKVKDLGWTKLRELATVLTAENVDAWVAQAKGATVLQVTAMVKASKSQGAATDEGGSGGVTSQVTTMTFKVHPDQKEIIRAALDKAKEDTGTEFDTVALEAICQAFMGGSVTVVASAEPVSLEALFKTKKAEEVLEAFEKVYPNLNIIVETE